MQGGTEARRQGRQGGRETGRQGDREAGRQGGNFQVLRTPCSQTCLHVAPCAPLQSGLWSVTPVSLLTQAVHTANDIHLYATHTRATTFSFFSFGSSSGRRPWPALPVLGGTRALPWPRLCAVGPAPAVTSAWHWLLGARATLGASPLIMPLPFWLIGSAMQARVVAGPPWLRAGGPRRLLGKGARLAPPPPTGRL